MLAKSPIILVGGSRKYNYAHYSPLMNEVTFRENTVADDGKTVLYSTPQEI